MNTRGTKSDGDLKGDNSTESVTRIRAGFDVDKCVCCTVEKDQILVHSGGGKGYGIGALAITSGCYQWKVYCKNNIYIQSVDVIIHHFMTLHSNLFLHLLKKKFCISPRRSKVHE